jgi:hypothetical protein
VVSWGCAADVVQLAAATLDGGSEALQPRRLPPGVAAGLLPLAGTGSLGDSRSRL